MMIDSIVASAGIWGCTVARRLAEAGGKVLGSGLAAAGMCDSRLMGLLNS